MPPSSSRRLLGRVRVKKTKPPRPPPPPPPPPPPYFRPDYAGPLQPVPFMNQTLLNPADCSGFLQPRVYIESQAWFTPDMPSVPDAVNTKSMHLHVGTCFPHRQWIAGFIAMNVLVQKHNFVPQASETDVRAEFQLSSSNVSLKISGATTNTSGWQCKNATDYSVLCMQVYQVLIPTISDTYIIPDGLNDLRLIATAKVNDGFNLRTMQARISSNVVINNSGNVPYPKRLRNVLPVTQIAVMAFPWAYTHAELIADIPLAPLKGNWTFPVRNFVKTNTANVTGVFISVDPVFHKNPVILGQTLKNLPSAGDLPISNCPPINGHVDCNFTGLTIDTTTFNDTTWHKLFIRTDSFVGNDDPLLVAANAGKAANKKIGGGTFSAVTLVMFRTNNTGTAPADPLPAPGDGSGTNGSTGPSGFTPPPGVVVFNGSQPIPGVEYTLNITANDHKCEGWIEPRTFIEGSSWYTRPEADIASGSSQITVGGCLPHGRKIAGQLPVDVLVSRIRPPPGSLESVNVTVTLGWGVDGSFTSNANFSITFKLAQRTAWTCDGPGNAYCKAVFGGWINTKPDGGLWVIPDGLLQVMLEATGTIHDGNSLRTFLTRAYSFTVLANNKDTDLTGRSLSAVDESKAKQGFPWTINLARLRGAVPVLPLTATWSFSTIHEVQSRTANLTKMYVAAQPTQKTWGPDGGSAPGPTVVLLDLSLSSLPASCPVYKPWRPECNFTNHQLDVTRICNGFYKIIIRTDSFVSPSDFALLAFNEKLAPEARVAAGTFSAGLAFAVQPRAVACCTKRRLPVEKRAA
eukprot:gene8002-8200_t